MCHQWNFMTSIRSTEEWQCIIWEKSTQHNSKYNTLFFFQIKSWNFKSFLKNKSDINGIKFISILILFKELKSIILLTLNYFTPASKAHFSSKTKFLQKIDFLSFFCFFFSLATYLKSFLMGYKALFLQTGVSSQDSIWKTILLLLLLL
jgi:hypothetical protein